jgi:hypothetical protein
VVLFGTQAAIAGPPRAMTAGQGLVQLDRFSDVRWIPSARGGDGIDDLLVVGANTKDASLGTAVGLVVGDAARLMSTPRFSAISNGRPLAGVAAGSFADPAGGVEVLALTGDRAVLYNVSAGEFVTQPTPDGIPVSTTLAPPIGTLRDGPGRARAVARDTGAGEAGIAVFSVRGGFTSCSAAAAGTPVELRGVDLDGDGVDEVAVQYTAASTGRRSLQVFRVGGSPACALSPALADALDGCVDVANVGERLIAVCRVAEAGSMANAAHTVFAIEDTGDGLARRPLPIADLQGDGRFAIASDFDGDGVLDVAIGVNRVSEVGVVLLHQCPAHDVRACR